MNSLVQALTFFAALILAAPVFAQQAAMDSVMAGVAKYAGRFDSAAGWAAQETMVQKGYEETAHHGLHVGFADEDKQKPEMITREQPEAK